MTYEPIDIQGISRKSLEAYLVGAEGICSDRLTEALIRFRDDVHRKYKAHSNLGEGLLKRLEEISGRLTSLEQRRQFTTSDEPQPAKGPTAELLEEITKLVEAIHKVCSR